MGILPNAHLPARAIGTLIRLFPIHFVRQQACLLPTGACVPRSEALAKAAIVKSHLYTAVLILGLASGLSVQALATSELFTGSSGSLSASALFSLSGNTLTVTLTNTSLADVLVPTDVLTAVWFNTSSTLTPGSASLNGSSVYYGSISNDGDGWGYGNGLNAHGKNSGISSSGAATGLGHSNFSGASNALQGLAYGLLSAGDNSATGNTGVTGHGPLIKNSSLFTLTVTPGFSLAQLGNSVVFQYGTALTDGSYNGTMQPIPEPATLSVLGAGLFAFGAGLKRRLVKA